MNRDQLGAGDTADSVLKTLADARLITIGDTEPAQVEVAHEALIRGWSRLRAWLDEDRESLKFLHRLTRSAEEWETHKRDAAFLYSGSRLTQLNEWAKEHGDDISQIPLANEFYKASVTARSRNASLDCLRDPLRHWLSVIAAGESGWLSIPPIVTTRRAQSWRTC